MKNANKAIIGQINIDSSSSKFNQLKEIVLKHADLLVVCTTKLNETFPNSQFHIDGFLPYRQNKNRNDRGFMIFVNEDMLSKLSTKHNFPSDVEGLFLEINFRKTKWLLIGTYHPPAQNDQYFFNCTD